uniref:Uncharacterized protein n=1 Tax=viral metagenome TaxID=1070528 RepID=A0A6C0DP52_9ZZZZ
MARVYAFELLIDYKSLNNSNDYYYDQVKEEEYANTVIGEFSRCIDNCIKYEDFFFGKMEHILGNRFKVVYTTIRPLSVIRRDFVMSCFEYYHETGDSCIRCNGETYFPYVEILYEVSV